MRKFYCALLSITLAIVATSTLNSQEYKYLNINNGLSSNHIWNVQQDGHGFIWILSRHGVDRYDGHEIVNYKIPENIHAHNGYGISRLKIFGDSNIYIFSSVTGNIYHYDEDNDTFKQHCKITPSEHWGATTIYSIYASQDGALIISTNAGLIRFAQGEYSAIKLYEGLTQENVLLCEAEPNNVFFRVENELFLFNTATDDLLSITKLDEASRSKSMLYDPRNTTIWMGNTNELLTYNISTQQFVNVTSKNNLLPQHPTMSISILPHEKVAIGLDGAGVRIIDIYSYEIEESITDESSINNDSLHGNGVYDISVDVNERLWIGTYSGGITIYDRSDRSIGQMVYSKTLGEKISNGTITSILEEDEDNMWFSTNNGVCHWNKSSDTWNQYLCNTPDNETVALCLAKDKMGNIYAGTFTQGLYVLKRGEGGVSYSLINNKAQYGDNIFELYSDDFDQIWMGRFHRNISIYNTQDHSVKSAPLKNAISMCRKSKDEIYVGTTAGLYSVNVHTYELQRDDKFDHNMYINDIHQADDSVLCIASSGLGLYRYDTITGEIKCYDTSNGMPSNFILAVTTDKDGNIWATIEVGLIKIDPKSENIEFFGRHNGLSTIGYIRKSIEHCSDNTIYVGASDGFSWFNPDSMHYTRPSVELYLKSFSISNQITTPDMKNSPITEAIDKCKTLILNSNQNTFSINFTTLGFYNQQDLRFEWKLDGFDTSWITAGKDRLVNYTNIPAGEYTLYLNAIENYSREVIATREIEIKVLPPFYNRWWAKLLMVLTVITIFVTAFKYYLMQINRKHSEDKIRFFANTAHDIRTPLALVNAPLQELNQEQGLSDRGRYYLNLACTNASKLNTLLSQLLDFQKSDNKSGQLVLSLQNIATMVESRANQYQQLALQRKIKYRIEIGVDRENLVEWIDAAKMERVIDNLITNALKYTPSEGDVIVSLTTDEHKWRVTIKDTGIGIPKSQHKKIFREYYRGDNAIASKSPGIGLGLILVRNYVRLHNGEVSFKSQEGVGSQFTIALRRGREHYSSSASYMNSNEQRVEEVNIMANNEPNTDITSNTHRVVENEDSCATILVVEDNDELRDYLRVSLSDHFNVTVSEDGRQALSIIKELSPDCVISDVKMPNIGGIEFVKRVRGDIEISHTPVILLTSLTSKSDMLEGFDIGADDYIFKPFDIDILRHKISAILRSRRDIYRHFALRGESVAPLESGDSNDCSCDALDISIIKDRERIFVEQVVEVIKSHMMDPDFSVEKLATECAVSKSLLFKKLKFITNQSPINFIKIIKFKHAMSLLQSGRYTVAEVATMTGFNDSKYFSTSFKAFFGKSPSKIEPKC